MAWTPTQFNSYPIGPFVAILGRPSSLTGATGMILDASGEKLGIRYIPSTTSPITAVDVRLLVAWSGSPATFKIGVFSESAGPIPNDAGQLGSYTAGFAAPATSGWTGAQALTPNDSGNLTLNTPVWIVIEYVSGTIGAGDSIQLYNASGSNAYTDEVLRHFNGTNWTTTATQNTESLFVVTHADGTYAGLPVTAALARSSAADVYLNTTPDPDEYIVQGVRFKCGSQVKVVGAFFNLVKTGSPSDLTLTVYEGNTSKASNTVAAATITSSVPRIAWFSSPVLAAADTNLYLILSQAGGSDTADYDLRVLAMDATYIQAAVPPDFRMVYGSQATITPSTLSVSTTEIPLLFPIIADPATDFDQAAGALWAGKVAGVPIANIGKIATQP